MKITILSIQHIESRLREAVFRFPLVCLISVVGTGLGLYLVDNNTQSAQTILAVLMMGFFLALAADVFSESLNIKKLYADILVVIFLALYYLFLPKGFDNFRNIDIFQTVLLGFVFILSLMVAPFLKTRMVNGFWQYNKKLLIRLFFVVVSTGTLYAGIALSLASLNYLFGLDIEEEWYLRIWILIAGLASTTVFLAGIPRKFEQLETTDDYPKVIEIFSKYILVPLMSLYTLILYLYGAKIILTQQWPKGQVSWMILLFSLFGIVTMILLYPERKKLAWVSKLSKFFYRALIPLIILLFSAVYLRIHEYGITESRFAIVVLGIWLAGLSAYFLLGKAYNIKLIFVSLGVLTLIFSFGPWSAFSVAKKSQISRLQKLLESNKILVDGKIHKVQRRSVPKEDQQSISSIADYLYEVDGLKDINKWFDTDITKLASDRYDRSEKIVKLMGIDYIGRWDTQNGQNSVYYSFSAKEKSAYEVKKFNHFYNFDWYNGFENKMDIKIDSDSKKFLSFENDGKTLNLTNDKGEVLATINLEEKADFLIDKYGKSDDILAKDLVIDREGNLQIRLVINSWAIYEEDNSLRTDHIDGYLFLQ